MKKVKLIIAIGAILLLFCSCEKPCTIICQNGGTVTENCDCDCPSGFAGAKCETSVCQLNNWAYIYFENRSRTNKKYTVEFDAAIRMSLDPGEKSALQTETAGNHTLKFRVFSSSTVACTETTINLPQCTTNTYYCTY